MIRHFIDHEFVREVEVNIYKAMRNAVEDPRSAGREVLNGTARPEIFVDALVRSIQLDLGLHERNYTPTAEDIHSAGTKFALLTELHEPRDPAALNKALSGWITAIDNAQGQDQDRRHWMDQAAAAVFVLYNGKAVHDGCSRPGWLERRLDLLQDATSGVAKSVSTLTGLIPALSAIAEQYSADWDQCMALLQAQPSGA